MHLKNLKTLLSVPDLASKKWIYQQYDSQVMNDTIQTGGDAAIVRVNGTRKALVMTTDCTPRYVEADAFEGAKQAVAETYRNISSVGGKPLAITNCLNFGNPQKPEIMGQIVRAIQGINEACKALDYPVVSGNVSLYNETDGRAIQPTPAIGGVGLISDLHKRSDIKFKKTGDEIFVVGKTFGHISCSLFEREILKSDSTSSNKKFDSQIEAKKTPPNVDLNEERKNGEFVRELINSSTINACHDISDGGLLVALFEMCGKEIGCELDLSSLKEFCDVEESHLLFGEDQSRYVVSLDYQLSSEFRKKADKFGVFIFPVGKVISEKISIKSSSTFSQELLAELIQVNEHVFEKHFS